MENGIDVPVFLFSLPSQLDPTQPKRAKGSGLLCKPTAHGAMGSCAGRRCMARPTKALASSYAGRVWAQPARRGGRRQQRAPAQGGHGLGTGRGSGAQAQHDRAQPIEASSSKEVEFLWSSSSFFLHFALVQFKGRKEQAQTWNWPQMVLKILSKYYWFLCKT
jgi:hypothetical protein